jgi:ParB-like chromosome segregation protein Spo0J
MTAVTKVWEGSSALSEFLVPIDTLDPFSGNARKGDVPAIRASLERFGQVRPILVDGTTIIGGHHLVLAAQELGWTHVAAIPNEFRDDNERLAYNVADNGTAAAGAFDDALLTDQLALLAEMDDGLSGTGFADSDLDAALKRLQKLDETGPAVIDAKSGKREHRDPGLKELVLVYSEADFAQAEIWLGIVARERGTSGTSESVLAALMLAAQQLNG